MNPLAKGSDTFVGIFSLLLQMVYLLFLKLWNFNIKFHPTKKTHPNIDWTVKGGFHHLVYQCQNICIFLNTSHWSVCKMGFLVHYVVTLCVACQTSHSFLLSGKTCYSSIHLLPGAVWTLILLADTNFSLVFFEENMSLTRSWRFSEIHVSLTQSWLFIFSPSPL